MVLGKVTSSLSIIKKEIVSEAIVYLATALFETSSR